MIGVALSSLVLGRRQLICISGRIKCKLAFFEFKNRVSHTMSSAMLDW